MSFTIHIVHGSMNNMNSKEQSKKLQKLSLSVGDFIRYWGFRRIHGAIWTQLYLSSEPLNCVQLTSRLGVSKALVCPALDELVEYHLIEQTPSPNEKTKMYKAATDINQVIRKILKSRESKILAQIAKDYDAFLKVTNNNAAYDVEKIKSLGEMILSANIMLEAVLNQNDLLETLVGVQK